MDMIHQLSQQVDIVSVELQFEETYNPWPTRDQVAEFRALHKAGADIVTGVQSHVPQAVEPYSAQEQGGPAVILYGLGNLFFDQMQSWETRTALIPRHTIYEGRLLNTELLTTVLEDFAQPRWVTPAERAEILSSIFEAAPPKDRLPDNPTPTPAPTPTTVPQPPAAEPQPTPTPLPSPTPLAENDAPPAASIVVNPHPQPTPPPTGVAILPWPAHQEGGSPHFFLLRPTGPEYNRMEDLGYAFGSTAGGRYRVHHGVDIANPSGTPLLAPAEGVVLYAGPDDAAHQYGPYPNFYGNLILSNWIRSGRATRFTSCTGICKRCR
jgi:murein DD-endopeptidase MepM/ murein hydrolase activator NlpD